MSDPQRSFRPTALPYRAVFEAVLFDWGDTLMQFEYDPELVEAGQRAGLKTIDRAGLPAVDALSKHFRERYEPLFWVPGTVEEIEYPGLVRQMLGDFGVSLDDEHPDGGEPDHQAFTQMDVLNIVSRLTRA